MQDLLIAMGLAIALEGALYALFPDMMRKSIAIILSLPVERVRVLGLIAACLGVGLVALFRTGM